MASAGLRDDGLPAAAELLSGDATAVLDAAVQPLGATVTKARARQVLYRPGRRVVVRFDVTLRLVSGAEERATLVAVGARGDLPTGVMVVELDAPHGQPADQPVRIGVWRYPFDPALPGLAAVLDPARVRALLDGFGVPPGPVTLTARAYRPERRAVVEATTSGHRLFLKVLPGEQAGALHRTHRLLAANLAVPDSLGWSPELGVVVLEPVPGETLRHALRAGAPLPAPAALLEQLDALSAVPIAGKARTGPIKAAVTHGRMLAAVLPVCADRLAALADQLGEEASQPVVTVHGDWYENQVLVAADGTPTGLLDVDGAGPGAHVDDLATMAGHLLTLSVTGTARAHAYAEDLLKVFAQVVDPAQLRRRTAAVVVGLATGPFRVQQRGWQDATRARLDMAEDVLARQARRG